MTWGTSAPGETAGNANDLGLLLLRGHGSGSPNSTIGLDQHPVARLALVICETPRSGKLSSLIATLSALRPLLIGSAAR